MKDTQKRTRRKDSKGGERRLGSCLEGGAVKVGIWIVFLELLNNPPRRSAVGYMVTDTSEHA